MASVSDVLEEATKLRALEFRLGEEIIWKSPCCGGSWSPGWLLFNYEQALNLFVKGFAIARQITHVISASVTDCWWRSPKVGFRNFERSFLRHAPLTFPSIADFSCPHRSHPKPAEKQKNAGAASSTAPACECSAQSLNQKAKVAKSAKSTLST